MRAYFLALLHYARPRRLALVLALMLAGALIEGVGLLLLVPVLSSLDHQGLATVTLPYLGTIGWPLPVWLALFCAAVMLRVLLTNWRNVDSARLRLSFVERLRNQLHAAIAGAQWRYLATTAHAELVQVLTTELRRVDSGTWCLLQLCVSVLLAAAALLVAMSLSPLLTLLTVSLGALMGALLRGRLGQVQALGKNLSEADQAFFATASDFFNGLKLIKSAGAEGRHVDDFSARTRTLSALELAFVVSQGRAQAWIALASALLISSVLLVSVHGLQLPTTELLLLLLIFARLLPLVSQSYYQLQQVLHMLPAFAAYNACLQRSLTAAEPEARAGEHAPTMHSALTFTAVDFHYLNTHVPALQALSLTIPARQTTALIGPSGAGKTTLADLILGLNAPDQGTIAVDGQVLEGSNRGGWRRCVGYVPQDAFLFPDSVRANLLWANPPTDEAGLWQVLELAAAADFVRALPQGLDTLVGERGIRLSGGERQRLALARALLRNPTLLVLDEATSQLDSENERLIQRALQQLHGQLTIVVIAHRLSTVREADQIVVLERGQIVEQGNWQSLLAAGGRFKELLDAALEPTPSEQEWPQGKVQPE